MNNLFENNWTNIFPMTFTWPGYHPLQVSLRHIFEILPARWTQTPSTWPDRLPQNAVEGISPGQVNVTRKATRNS